MKLTIDNTDCTLALDPTRPPRVIRRLNRPSEMKAALIGHSPAFVVPAIGRRIVLEKNDGTRLFTGYLDVAPEHESLGWNGSGPAYRYVLHAISDEYLLDRRLLPDRPAAVHRTAGEILRQVTADAAGGDFDGSAVQDVETIPIFSTKFFRWSERAGKLCQWTRSVRRAHDGAISLHPVAAVTHAIDEADPKFSAEGLKLERALRTINDLWLYGNYEPGAYVKDYFVGDNVTLTFPLSRMPFTRYQSTIVEDEYAGDVVDGLLWTVADPAGAIAVSGGKVNIDGGTGADGATTVCLYQKLELGGALFLQHGSVTFSEASHGVIGGLYDGAVSIANCVAGFRLTPSGAQTLIRALINGVETGTGITTVASHRYVFTTRLYAREFYRERQSFHSSAHPAGSGRGGEAIASAVRVVLEVHDIDPANPGSEAAVSTILYDDVLAATPGFCTYAVVNAASMHASVAFTRLMREIDAEVRSAFPGFGYKTRLVGYVSDGAECRIFDTPELYFHPEHLPASGEKIEVRYRASRSSLARVQDSASIAALAAGSDDGMRTAIVEMVSPAARTSRDCDNAALAILDDANSDAWSGRYEAWDSALGADVLPGDLATVTVPSRGADFAAIIREVELECIDPANDRSRYVLAFANDAAEPLALDWKGVIAGGEPDFTLMVESVDSTFIADLPDAEITSCTSTTVSIDAGVTPPAGGGIEVRRGDSGWGSTADRNLIGRFTTRTFTVTRLSRIFDCCLRQYDASGRYSRYSTVLHLDYPL